MYYDILDKKRIEILPLLKNFKNDFYMAGGTALALQIGHRDSIDFDFFSKDDIDTSKLFEKIREVFKEHKILKVQEEKNTLSLIIDDNIKFSFFSYKYDLLNDLCDEENINLASIEDIACMKLTAILGRSTNKDYIDLYYILKKYDLAHLLALFEKKYNDTDINLVLKSLVYFEDIEDEPIIFKHKKNISLEKVQKFLVETVKNYNK